MAGGHATHSGIGFQDKAAAVIAIHVLANEPLPLLGLPGGVTVSNGGAGQKGEEIYLAENGDDDGPTRSLPAISNCWIPQDRHFENGRSS